MFYNKTLGLFVLNKGIKHMKQKFGNDVKILWQDKIRHFGLPISFTKYSLVQKEGLWTKLIVEKGWLSTSIDEVNVYRIYDVSVFVDLIAKMYKVGNVLLYCDDASHQKITLKNIKNPYQIHRLITDIVEEEKKNRKYFITESQN